MPRRPIALLVLAATSLLIAACGSTVQVRGTVQTSGGSGVSTTGSGEGAAGHSSGDVAATNGGTSDGSTTGRLSSSSGAAGSGSFSSSATSGAAAPDATSSTGGPAASQIPLTGRGWDAKTVYVGVVTQNDTQRVFAQFGADAVNPGDTEKQAQAAIDAINAGGGMLGRTVKVRFRDVQLIETNQNPSGVGNAVCSYFTQDAPVVAVWNVSTQIDQAPTLRSCLAKAGIPFFSTAARAIDDTMIDQLAPSYYHALAVSWTRLSPVLVARLKAQGYFAGWNTTLGRAGASPVVVGILVEDEPQGKRTATALQKALAAAGYPKSVVYAYDAPEKGQSATVQYFKGNNVTHVIVTDVELAAFQQAAASQQYKPRYGITTYNAPYNNLEASGLTPAGANEGAMGVGWALPIDVGSANEPGPAPGWPRCAKAMAKQGQTFGSSQRLAQAYASMMCDALFLLDQGAEAGRGFSAQAVRRGIVSVAPHFPIAIGFAPALGTNSPFIPGVVRDLAWHSDCSCMKYGTTKVALPR